MAAKEVLVAFEEAPSIMVGRFLLEKGFDLATCTGVAERSLTSTSSIGILRPDPDAKPQKRLFGLIKSKPRREFLGTVWFLNTSRRATEKNWTCEVYGRNNIDLIKSLAEEMAARFNVKITLRLVREDTDVEMYPSDFGH